MGYQLSTFKFLLLIILLITLSTAYTQIKHPVKWDIKVVELGNKQAELRFTAAMEEGWHIYALRGGLSPTEIIVEPSEDYVLIGELKEGSGAIVSYDSILELPLKWFKRKVTFKQRIKVLVPSTSVKGHITFMTCNDVQCLPVETITFKIPVSVKALSKDKPEKKTEPGSSSLPIPTREPVDTSRSETVKPDFINSSSDSGGQKVAKKSEETLSVRAERRRSIEGGLSIVEVFIAGFLGGLAALMMPCIFPMIPFTVGMFSKNGQMKGGGSVMLSLVFGLTIVIVYVLLGTIITFAFGSDALNDISTNGFFNFIFFLLLVIFAASFLGAFELTLPSSWATRIDAGADQFRAIGIPFAAVTLAIVSFSCTGPIIGTLLVEASASGNYLGPTIGMLGFSIALALPFTFFSMFPSLLKRLPKSGSWLNSVKVVLGFLELALALKFLSNVDLAYHWNWFDREVFLVLWIIIFGLLGFYLLGKIQFIHDTAIERVSVGRLFLVICTLAFTLYLIPGLWGAPLKVVAAFLPPQHTQDFDLYNSPLTRGDAGLSGVEGRAEGLRVENSHKYSNLFHAPLGLNTFFDYEEGMAYARQVNKPVLIDFTGHACVNCRKMEAAVWPEPEVLNLIKNEYVLIQLYVDDKTELPEAEQITSSYSNKKLLTIGNKWSDLQASVYNTNSQPYYVLLDSSGRILVTPQGANYNVNEFANFLRSGLTKY